MRGSRLGEARKNNFRGLRNVTMLIRLFPCWGVPTWHSVRAGKSLRFARRWGLFKLTHDRWRQKYGSMAPEMARELKTLQKENA